MANDSRHDDALELVERGWSARREGNLVDARRDLSAAIDLFREMGDHANLATALGRLGHVEMDQKRWDAARAIYEEAISVCKNAGDVLGLAHKTRHLGDVHRYAGRTTEAERCYRDALSLYERFEDPPALDFANAARMAAILGEEIGNAAESMRLWSKARHLYQLAAVQDGVDESTRSLDRLSDAVGAAPLTPATESRLRALFDEQAASEATDLLFDRCGRNLPLMRDKQAAAIERIRIAALKVSGGDLEALRKAVDLANIDWRDLLVAAGFAHDTKAHLKWMPTSGNGPPL
ncbi:MAG: tetratricopeptide repeat protein [Rhodothermales bacterium]|nr:tetratricopeptide repeat protein [Rhodothermales bacterium]